MIYLINTLVLLAFCVAMEGAAWFAHKYLMHGPLWFLHKDHHQSTPSFFELNDFFFLFFAIPSWLLIMFGMMDGLDNWKVYAGLGIALYGIIYFTFHEVFVHQRFKWFRNTKNKYLINLRKAHYIHHRKKSRLGCSNFGLMVFRTTK